MELEISSQLQDASADAFPTRKPYLISGPSTGLLETLEGKTPDLSRLDNQETKSYCNMEPVQIKVRVDSKHQLCCHHLDSSVSKFQEKQEFRGLIRDNLPLLRNKKS